MKLSELLREDRILVGFRAKDRDGALGALVDKLADGFDRNELLSGLLKREELGSTGVGEGVALPHIRLDGIQTPVVVVGLAEKPVDFQAIDEEPCSIFFLVLGGTSEDAQEPYLSALAKISRLMRDESVRERIRNATGPREVIDLVRESEA